MSGIRFFLEGAKLTWSKRWLKRIAEWMVDLVIVFVGVYAAFVLNAEVLQLCRTDLIG
jgi:hypothetical protein